MKKTISLLLCIVVLCAILVIPAAAAADRPAESTMTLEDCDGMRLGVLTGSIHDTYAKKYFPNAQLQYFAGVSDMIAALQSGAIDSFSNDILSVYALLAENDRLAYINSPLDYMPTAFAFAKTASGEQLRDEMDEFLQKTEKDGSLAALQEKWLSYNSGDYELDMTGLTGNGRTVVFATSCSGKPNAYYYNGAPTGYEVELAAMFCREFGYDLDIQVTDFAGIIPGLASGKFDIGADGIAVTAEREQSVYFSVPDYNSAVVMVVRKDTAETDSENYTSVRQLDRPDVSLGIVTGMSTEYEYSVYTPKAQLKYYNTLSDVLYALSSGQIEGFLDDDTMTRYLAATVPGLAYIDEPIGEPLDTAFVIGDTDFDKQLQTQLDEFLARGLEDGTVRGIISDWSGEKAAQLSVSIPADGPNGTVRAAVSAEIEPACFMQNNELVGFEIDILSRFCTEYGYGLEFTNMDFGALLNSVSAGKHDIACGYISVTEERKTAVSFSVPYGSSQCLMLIRAPKEEAGFWSNLAGSFERTFIKEQRWKLIVQGIETTVLISLCAAALGTVLGFALCLLRMGKSRTVHGITTVFIRIMQGTPMLVLLMILYYIVFAGSSISGEAVSVIAFALNFAAYTCEMFRTGIESVDRGQTEAALALGYTKRQSFMRIVMPQAAMHFLPVFKGEFISLVKMTSIVGYIAVQDLTKMSDIIRARTYEAFFPMIATAAIYFLLSALLTALLRAVELKIEPDRVNRTVKGVKMQ